MVSRLDLVVLRSAASGIDFHRLPYGLWNIGVLIEQRGGAGGHRGGYKPLGRTWAPRRALVGCAPLGAPSGTSLAQQVSSGPEKISKEVLLCLDSIWYLFSAK